MWILSHPTGNMNVRQNTLALAEAGLLAEFWTCVNFDVSAVPWKWLSKRFQGTLARRSFTLPGNVKIHTHPWREMGRHATAAAGICRWSTPVSGPLSVDGVYRSLDRRVARQLQSNASLTGVFCSEDGALESFRMARDLGKTRIYELPIGYWRAAREILEEEAERMPEWAVTLTGNNDPAEKLARKDEELALADAVLVASSFTCKTLEKAPDAPKKVLVLPYAATEGDECAAPGEVKGGKGGVTRGKPLRVLYVGSLTQRKGLAYLLAAVENLVPHVELTLIGREAVKGCKPLETALRQHRWIPSLSHQAILEQMRQHDVLVLPSLFEGFGLVLVEALSQGLPIIATSHTGAPDVIEHGREGFIVPIRDEAAIRQSLEICLNEPERLRAMGLAARQRSLDLRWDRYRMLLAAFVASLALDGH